jgi:uncharacterized membrane protein YcaP (DUF421 family)
VQLAVLPQQVGAAQLARLYVPDAHARTWVAGCRCPSRGAAPTEGSILAWLATMPDFLFNGFQSVLRIVLVGTGVYLGLVLLIRVSGKQSLAKRTGYGLSVTVALGSVLATSLLPSQVSLVDGLLGFALLLSLQHLLSVGVARFKPIEYIAATRPRLVLSQGEPDEAAMGRERLTLGDLRAAARAHGFASLEQIDAMILESDGTLSVIAKLEGSCSALDDVEGAESAIRPPAPAREPDR